MIKYIAMFFVKEVLVKVTNLILVNLIAKVSPVLFIEGFLPLIERVNALFEKKSKTSKFPKVWAEAKVQLIAALKQTIALLEKV